ncbi:21248_t:CDS:10, partial [Racocetra persica]
KEELSDSIVITVSYIAIGPFFVDSVNSSNSIFGNGLEAVKLVALGLLRSIFTNHQKQRTWILEEILTSLIKLPTVKRNLRQYRYGFAYILPYRLPDGKSIQMVSALILQLIQSCTVGITHFGLKSVDDQQGEQLVENLTNGVPNDLKKCSSAWKIGIDSASSNAGYIFKFLLARCTKSIKNSNESEYRVLLDNFMEDVITVLNYPEWPAAEMIVRIFSKFMIGYINDKKADNYTKSMAIDYLGIIAGRIKKFANTGLISGEGVSEDNGEDNDDNDNQNWIDKIKDIPRGDITILNPERTIKNLRKCQKAVLTFLEFGAMEDPGVQASEWGYSFANTLLSINEKQTDLRWGDKDDASLASITKLMNKIVAEYWQMSSENQIVQSLEHRTQHVERTDIHLVTELLATRQALYQNFDTILSRILVSLDTGVVAFRTKALRALGQVVVCDPGILSQVNVRQTIAQRFSDNSPAVRDAAIELVGRYLAQKPEITEQYYKVISDRVLDTGLNVRKRVIKLLRDIYLKSSDQEMKIDIGCKILIRVNDDDDHVKDLALKTIQELWFAPFKHQKNFYAETYDLDDDDNGQNEFNIMPTSGKKDVLARSLLIVGVAGRLGERNGHIMGGLFKKILDKDGKQKREIMSICQCIVDCLFEHLLTLQDSNSKTEVVSCISTICLLCNASPLLVRKHVVTLQPYLKSSSTSEDQSILYYVLIIYRNVLPLLKRPNPNFLNEVEQTLMGLLTKSPQK